MKTLELKNKSKSELNKMLEGRRERLRQLCFDLAQGKVKDTSQIKKTKKDIARVLTLLKNLEA